MGTVSMEFVMTAESLGGKNKVMGVRLTCIQHSLLWKKCLAGINFLKPDNIQVLQKNSPFCEEFRNGFR